MPILLVLPPQIAAVAGIRAPAAARPAGYAALIAARDLRVPPPDEMIAIGQTHTLRREGRWRILTPRYRPGDTVKDHLDFALRHEGIALAVLNALFRTMPADVIVDWIKSEPAAQNARRLWFLYEWLTGTRVDLPDRPRPLMSAFSTKGASSPRKGKLSPAIGSGTTCRARRISAR